MKINRNMSAVLTNRQMLRTENRLSASMERLSSGLKINRAGDNPAGLAISNKMKAQIDGLNQAQTNTTNGDSVLRIADGALNEVSSILQRMRELSVQAANDTNSADDKKAIQAEIDQLKMEVDRISTDTEYNTKNLLDGTSDVRSYAKGLTRIYASDAVRPGNYVFKIDNDPTATPPQPAVATQAATTVTPSGTLPEGSITINGEIISFDGTETDEEFYEKLRAGAEKANVQVFVTDPASQQDVTDPEKAKTGGYKKMSGDDAKYASGKTLAFVSDAYGENAVVEISAEPAAMEGFLGSNANVRGKDMKIDLDLDSDFGKTATVAVDGRRVTITDNSGFELDFMVDAGKAGDFSCEVTDIGSMTVQIGANQHQEMDVRIPEVSSESLYLDRVDVTKNGGADRALVTLDEAIAKLSEVRSRIGAYQNRLEYATRSLSETEEDMTAAYSNILDTDMAEEMTEYTLQNVLQQASVSVLSQANDLPQQVLSLLQ